MNPGYDDTAYFQHNIAAVGRERLVELVPDVLASDGGSDFVYADYGCGPGAAAFDSATAVFGAAHSHEPSRNLIANLQDQPGNDWSTVTGRIRDYSGAADNALSPISWSMCVGSFYNQVLPAGSVHVASSIMAVHFLSAQPNVTIPRSASPVDAEGDDRQRLAQSAAADWLTFWQRRSVELKPGGAMVVRPIGSDDGRSRTTAVQVNRALGLAAHELAGRGILAQSFADSYVIGAYPRTLQELREPFDQGRLPDLELVEASMHVDPDPIRMRYESDGDADRYARDLTLFVRGWSDTSVRTNLVKPGLEALGESATPSDIESVTNQIYGLMEEWWRQDPDSHPFEAWTPIVVVRRR